MGDAHECGHRGNSQDERGAVTIVSTKDRGRFLPGKGENMKVLWDL